MAINWNMGGPQDNALAYFQFGNQIGSQMRERQDRAEQVKREEAGRNALAAYAVNPTDAGFATAVGYDPRSAIAMRSNVRDDAKAEQEAGQKRIEAIAKLFHGITPQNYRQRYGVAQQMGIDMTGVPEQFDPQWVSQTEQIFSFYAKNPAALSGAGKQAVDMGLEPGSPEYEATVRQLVEAQLAKPYLGSGGETRLYTPHLGGAAPVAPPQEAIDALIRGEGSPEEFDAVFGAGAARRAMIGGN